MSATPEAESRLDLTVVTPSYGYAHYLRDAIESVAEQQGITVEHIIQDGGSTDGTVELLAGARRPRGLGLGARRRASPTR